MASDETMTFQSSFQDEDFDYDIEDGYDNHDDQHPHPHNLSRLSVCTSSTLCGIDDYDNDDDDVDHAMTMYVSRLSIESFEGDADGELSDGKEQVPPTGLLSSDSENELGSCYSLPATPPRRRNRVGVMEGHTHTLNNIGATKDYASDNEAQKGITQRTKNNDPRRRRSRRVRSDRFVFDRASRWENSNSEKNSGIKISKGKEEDQQMVHHHHHHHHHHGLSGESDQSVGGGVMLITRPKGGNRSLCMDLDEVKACRDLGFELEHERMLEVPSRLSMSNSTLETSSGSNSPIANWRISGPGDDPRDVKARLKVWAQAVALASTSKYGT